MKVFFCICGFIFLTYQTATGKEIYNSDFGNKGITGRNINGVRELVKITDLAEVTTAMRLTTISKDNKHFAPSWYSPKLKINKQGTVIVDYYVKQLSNTGRYGVFVSSEKRQLVAIIFSGGRILYRSEKQWKSAGKYKLNEWYRIRYIINTECKTYDLYVNNMSFPVAKNIAYRDAKADLPSRVWLPGAALKGAKSEYAEIKVRYKLAASFPSAQLSRAPFYLIGLGDDKVEVKLTNNEGMPTAEKGKFLLSHNEEGLIFDFTGEGKFSKGYIRKQKPWENDCIEIFIDPGKTCKRYFHFAVDSFGQRYQARLYSGKRDGNWKGQWESKITYTSSGWNCKVFVPFLTLGATLRSGDVWGLNLGRENSRAKQLSSWVVLNNFHQVKRFGNLILKNKNAISEYETEIAKKIYNTSEIQLEIKKMSKQLSKLSLLKPAEKRFLRLKRLSQDIINNYNRSKAFIQVYEQYLALINLRRRYENFTSIQERCAKLFKANSKQAQNGYAILPEISMRKIKQVNYIPDKIETLKLGLAGNEFGSIQLVVMADSVNDINKLKVSFLDLIGEDGAVIKKENISSYLVEYIKTAIPGKEQKEIADMLIPGKEFALKRKRKTTGLWIDFYVPAKSKPGIYNGEIIVQVNNKKARTINYQIEVYPFSLPAKISLQNVFCFVPKWAEQFYGEKMPREKRKLYFDFLLKHRLSPVNLWGKKPLLNEQELKYTRTHGASVVTLRPDVSREYVEMLRKNGYLKQAVFFAGDEVQDRPHEIAMLKRKFTELKQKYPEIPRLCTAWIDPRLYGAIDIWCPRFQQKHFSQKLEKERRAKGEKIWWYFTDGPGSPYANLNLNSPDIDPRIIPWLTWKAGATGLLYWAVNREWKTNGGEQLRLTNNDIMTRSLNWLDKECKKKITRGLRWPQIPWIPVFISAASHKASCTNGGGNLMYPGPNWTPYPSIRIKNLRDGIQDYEYFIILSNLLRDKKLSPDLRMQIAEALKINNTVVASTTKYTKNPNLVLKEKSKLANLIIKAKKGLRK